MKYKIDAKDKILGRLASEVAILLRGKSNAKFTPYRLSGDKVLVYNTDKLKLTGKKLEQKLYRRHSGYIGNLKEEKLKSLMLRDSRIVFRKAVWGMLPKNRLRKKIIRNLILKRGGEKEA